MIPTEFKKLVRAHVADALETDFKVIWPNSETDTDSPQVTHAEAYFRTVDGGQVTWGGQHVKERYEVILFVSIRTPLGGGDDEATGLCWDVLRQFRRSPQGVTSSPRRHPREDGEIRGMWQETAVVHLRFDYNALEV